MKHIVVISLYFLLISQTLFPQWILRTSGTTNNLRAVDFIDGLNITIVGEFGTILQSTNGGVNWHFQFSGTNDHLYGVSFTNENYGNAVGANGTILRTTDGGISWLSQASGTVNTLNSVSLTDENNGIAVGYGGIILRTTDAGINWLPQISGTTWNLWGVLCFNPNIATAVGENSNILKTTDGGVTWIQQSVGTTYFLRSISCSDIDNCISVGYYGSIIKSTDGGSSWLTLVSGTTKHFYSASFRATNYVNAVGRLGIIMGSSDGGNNWMEQPGWTNENLYGVSFVNADTGIAVGNNGVIRMTNSAGVPVELVDFTAEMIEDAVVLKWVTATETNNHLFEIERKTKITNFRTIGYVEGSGTTTEPKNYIYIDKTVDQGINFYRLKQFDYNGIYEYSSEIEINITFGLIFSLEQNYPNPFNPSTKIKYTIPDVALRQAQSDIPVTLKVYDILGNEVATLVNEEQPAGNYEAEFNIHSDGGQNLPSGIYFYQLRVRGPEINSGRGMIETKKMILLK